MARLAIYSNGPSDTVDALKSTLAGIGVNLVKIKRQSSVFRGQPSDLIINYGSSTLPATRIGHATVLNSPEIISNASNKLTAFRQFTAASVKTVPWTADSATAQQWLDDGKLVYARTTLQGHSGEGIVLAYGNPAGVGDAGDVRISETLPRAPLYTQAILSERREYRIHVMKGKITYVQQKKRRDGYRDIEGFSMLVRNHHTGWIYAAQQAEPNDEAKREALKAIEALGLDYGAVDIITRRDEAWVLEVNTAPGMSGTNLETFAANIKRIFEGGEPTSVMTAPALTALQEEIRNAEPNTTPSPRRTAVRENVEARQSQQPVQPVPAAPAPAPQTAPAQQRTTNQRRAETNSSLITGGEVGGEADAMMAHQQNSRRNVAAGNHDTVATPASRTRQTAPTIINNGVYRLTVSGEVTVGKFVQAMNHFEIIGWEVPVDAAEATVGEALCVL